MKYKKISYETTTKFNKKILITTPAYDSKYERHIRYIEK